MKQRLIVVSLAFGIFIIAITLLQLAINHARSQQQFQQTPQQQSIQDDVDSVDTDVDLGETKIGAISLICLIRLKIMTHAAIFEIFKSLDIDEIITVKIALPNRILQESWIISDVRMEDEGLYVQYFPFQRGEVQLAFIPILRISNYGITAVKRA